MAKETKSKKAPAAATTDAAKPAEAKRGRGRPKGSTNKPKVAVAAAAPEKRKAGRPKGSTNKARAAAAPVSAEKRGPGRPKGSTNQAKAVAAAAAKSEKRGPGRPKGSTNKAKAAAAVVAPTEKRKPGRPKGSTNKAKAAAPTTEKRKPGRPKGSTNKAKAPAAAKPAAAAKAGRTPRASKLDKHLDIVGKMSDRDVGAKLGMTAENVRMYRKRRNIAATWAGGEAAKPAKAAKAAAVAAAPTEKRKPGRPKGSGKQAIAAASGAVAYAVEGSRGKERRALAIQAAGPVEAATKAVAALGAGWTVENIRRLETV